MEDLIYEKGGKKYYVNYDKEDLTSLRLEVIDNLSMIMHKEYIGRYGPYYRKKRPDPLSIRNYKKIDSGKYIAGAKSYRFVFDEYKFPYIESLITKLLNDDISSLDEVFNPNYDKEFDNVSFKISTLENKLRNTKDINEKILVINALKSYLVSLKKEKDNHKSKPYYEKLQSLIHLEEIKILKKL